MNADMHERSANSADQVSNGASDIGRHRDP
jgi:hypothetical protein